MSGALVRAAEHSTSDHWDTGLKSGVSSDPLLVATLNRGHPL